ncbi:MAG TPA: divergent polysaccharide deacetylase family protein [Pseudolabrys sp.]|nr:divergent polysaccharide deacetylase family protein [Pseudolabrys sp.]
MASDDLNTPLGLAKLKRKQWLLSGPQMLAGAMTGCGFVVVCWAVLVNDPLGGEPTAVVSAKLPGDTQAKPDAAGDGKQHNRYDGPNAVADAAAKAAIPPPGSKTVTIIDGSNGQRQDIVIPGNSSGASEPAAAKSTIDQKMLETTRHGAVPQIAADGTRPSAAYAKPRQLPANRKDAPRIAIIIGGIGISASGTADAFSKLPAPVTFALAPYATDLDRLAESARAENHELLLQVPMEPFDYPDNDPGPQTLLTTLTGGQNVDRLQWLMSRMRGYVGITSYMGAKFTSQEQSLSPVLRETSKRGLIFVDDGSSPRSVASQVAGSHSLPFAKTDVVIDATPTAAEIERALARLEMLARDNGSAVGIANAQPGTIARIADWAKAVETRGFVLVPVTMVAIKPKSS